MTVEDIMRQRQRNLEALSDLAHDMQADAPDTAALLAWARRELDYPLRVVGPDGSTAVMFTMEEVQKANARAQVLGAERALRACVAWLAEQALSPDVAQRMERDMIACIRAAT